jgi:hypothetical protein
MYELNLISNSGNTEGIWISDYVCSIFVSRRMAEFIIEFINNCKFEEPGYFEVFSFLLMSYLETNGISITDGTETVIIDENELQAFSNELKEILHFNIPDIFNLNLEEAKSGVVDNG